MVKHFQKFNFKRLSNSEKRDKDSETDKIRPRLGKRLESEMIRPRLGKRSEFEMIRPRLGKRLESEMIRPRLGKRSRSLGKAFIMIVNLNLNIIFTRMSLEV